MREILFRGKRIDNGEWIYGFYVENETFDGKRTPQIISEYIAEKSIIPKTVGQYTGLTDKNGKKIFEGDILKISFIKDFLKAVVKFGYYSQPDKILRTHLGFYFDFIDPIDSKLFKKDAGYWIGRTQSEIEVIGNVFDNSLEE